MTTFVRVAALLTAFASVLCGESCIAASISVSDRAKLVKSVDRLCQWSGMTRAADLSKVAAHPADGRWRYTAETKLTVDGTLKHYKLGFDANFRVLHFTSEYPASGSSPEEDISLGYDTLRDRRLRRMCMQAVTKLNSALGWKFVGEPLMQKVGSHFIVTFVTITAEERKEAERSNDHYLDPYVSFVVTRKGTVFGAFWGS